MQPSTRSKLLAIFSEHEGEFVSGQKISDQLGCSRTAVWKHIEELRQVGYELEAVQRKGYRIMSKPDRVSSNEIQLGLKTEFIGRAIHYEEVVDSTQKIAHVLSNEDAPEGTVVVAEQQTAGRGRLNRSWESPKHSGIWMSIILRPKIMPQRAPQLTLLAAVAVVQAIQDLTNVNCEIKWPNDILINGKKLVGILTELQSEPDRIKAVIIGIGINANQDESDFPEWIQNTATSIALESGRKINRAELMQVIFKKIEKLYADYLKHGFKVIKLLWESYAISIGQNIVAKTLNGSIKGKALGINEDGVLLVEGSDGKIHKIHSADIEIPARTT
jgi:BirA family transcriptional regulator, biotin operon repressor / biotin---[acetyl-CoA-carboxylase] ligase